VDGRIEAILRETNGPAVLDVGCVGGFQEASPDTSDPLWLHGHLRAAFDDVWGIDLSPTRIEALRARGYGDIHVADAESFELDRRFNSIVAGELIEHLANPGMFLRRCGEHLAEGGRIVLTTPYPFSYETTAYAWFRYPRTCPNREHTMWFCPKTMERLADLCGFQIRSWRLLRADRQAKGLGPYAWAVRAGSLFKRLPERIAGVDALYVLATR
jgi:2-polyprenyl-3-methyl-5-hydroxy-6-metoxy-1,4-benzoquinol methylase